MGRTDDPVWQVTQICGAGPVAGDRTATLG